MNDKVLAIHPDGKNGVKIDKTKYETMRSVILQALKVCPEQTYKQLVEAVRQTLADAFEGSIEWYCITVKLDLEARGILERVPNSAPHRIRIANT